MIDLRHLRGHVGAAALVAVSAALVPASAVAADRPLVQASSLRPAVVLPTTIRPETADRAASAPAGDVARELDGLLADTAQDLGLSVDLTDRAVARPAGVFDRDLAARARASGGLVIAPSVELRGDEVELRLALATPSSPTLRMRVERVARDDLAVRAAVMLRDLLADLDGAASRTRQPAPEPPSAPPRGGRQGTATRSAGRATLVANATVYGGLVGYSIQRSSGSEDPRLLYPLLAVGAGIGFGGGSIIAEEWDVGVGGAWFLSSGAWWPTIAGHLIYEGRFAPHARDPDQERWAFGVVGGTTGIALATLGLARRRMSDGGALTAHSGGGLGLLLGGLAEWAAAGDVNSTPIAGMGYGAAFGWLAAAAAATQIDVSPSRVLAIDIGALLGGLGGAALGSPLVFESPTEGQQRAWVGATAGGFLVGAGVAWLVTRAPAAGAHAAGAGNDAKVEEASWMSAGLPMIGVVGQSVVGRRQAPVLGLGWQGSIP